MKLKIHLLIPVAGLLSLQAHAQLIDSTPSLSVTNAIEIGQDVAREKLIHADNSVQKHLLLDSASGQCNGVILEKDAGLMYLFDSKGLLNLIVKSNGDNAVCVFDTHGKWLYVVKNERHLFDASGKMRAVLTVRDDKVIVIPMESFTDEPKPKRSRAPLRNAD